MNITNLTNIFDNDTLSAIELANPCPRQRSITRPILFVHNHALFFFGSIFNFLAFAILMQRSLRYHSTFAYLAFLSLSNGLLSLVHFSKWMFNYYFNIQFGTFLITCRFDRFSSDFLTHFSLFTLVCVNIDRARTVTKNRPSTKYSKSKFHIVLIKEFVIASILCAFHFHWIIKYGYEVFDGDIKVTLCTIDDDKTTSLYYYFLTTIYPPFELGVFFCLPLLINIFCTIIIVRSLRVRMRTAKQFRPSKINFKDQTKKRKSLGIVSYFIPKTTSRSNIHSCLCFQIQCRRQTRIRLKLTRNKQSLIKYEEDNHSIDRNKSETLSTCPSHDNQTQSISKKNLNILNKKHRTRRTRDIHLSAMLIGLNILYLLLNLPFNLHQTFVKRFHNGNSDRCEIMFVSILLDALQQTFFSTNFFLYVLTNRRFREEFCNTIISILSHCKKKSSTNLSNQKRRTRTSSCNLSNQIITLPFNQKRDSLISDIELLETCSIQQQQTSILIDESNKYISRLVMFKDLPSDN